MRFLLAPLLAGACALGCGSGTAGTGLLRSANDIVDTAGSLRSDWLALVQERADRFVLGSDVFYSGTAADANALAQVGRVLDQLPSSLAYQVGCENAVKTYRLSSGC